MRRLVLAAIALLIAPGTRPGIPLDGTPLKMLPNDAMDALVLASFRRSRSRCSTP